MYSSLFNEKKASQAAAYLLYRSGPRMTLPILKLLKLLYLAERLSYEKYCEPLIGDRLVSMPHGPVLSITYNYMNGELDSSEDGWGAWIGNRQGYDISVNDPQQLPSPDVLLELSDSDIELLDQTWARFGHLNKFQLVEWTHRNCLEWRDPKGSMVPMTYGDLFKALEFSETKAEKCIQHLENLREINSALEQELQH